MIRCRRRAQFKYTYRCMQNLCHFLLATQLLLLTDFDLYCVNLNSFLCKTIDSFIEFAKAKSITVNNSKLNLLQLIMKS